MIGAKLIVVSCMVWSWIPHRQLRNEKLIDTEEMTDTHTEKLDGVGCPHSDRRYL